MCYNIDMEELIEIAETVDLIAIILVISSIMIFCAIASLKK